MGAGGAIIAAMLLRLGHSPDPDDAFMFYGLAKNKLDTGRYQFEHILQDIQSLNERARHGQLEITAVSIHAFPYVAKHYALTSCGSSMGDGYGPMVVTRQDGPRTIEDLQGKHIAIPGVLTTAFLTLQLVLKQGVTHYSLFGRPYEEVYGRDETVGFSYTKVGFDQIPQRLAAGEFDAGLIIHEGQLTFEQLKLRLIVDLGAWWKEKTGLPLPLGGNCIRKDLGRETMQEVTDILKRSIHYSLDHRAEAVEYALQFGRDLDRKLADRFVGMYVNDWTLDYGSRGREAIDRLLSEGAAKGLVPPIGKIDYVTARS
jgi:1,4-dihydroxy-6-naphthoate synthase